MNKLLFAKTIALSAVFAGAAALSVSNFTQIVAQEQKTEGQSETTSLSESKLAHGFKASAAFMAMAYILLFNRWSMAAWMKKAGKVLDHDRYFAAHEAGHIVPLARLETAYRMSHVTTGFKMQPQHIILLPWSRPIAGKVHLEAVSDTQDIEILKNTMIVAFAGKHAEIQLVCNDGKIPPQTDWQIDMKQAKLIAKAIASLQARNPQIKTQTVKELLDEADEAAQEFVSQHQEDIEKIAAEILAKETLTRDEAFAILDLPEDFKPEETPTPPCPSA